MTKLALHWQVIIGLILGVAYAWLSVTLGWNEFTLNYIQPFGDIFINLLKLIAVPLGAVQHHQWRHEPRKHPKNWDGSA